MEYVASQKALYVFFPILFILFLIGIFGNALVILIYKKREKNSSRIFILALAFVDIFTCIILMPVTIPYTFGYYVGGVYYIYATALDFTFIFMGFLFTSISIDRYFALAKPLVFAFKGNRALYAILLDILLTILMVVGKRLLTLYAEIYLKPFIFGLFIVLIVITVIMYTLAFIALREREKNKIGIKILVKDTNQSTDDNGSTFASNSNHPISNGHTFTNTHIETKQNDQLSNFSHISKNIKLKIPVSNVIKMLSRERKNKSKSSEAKKIAKILVILTILFAFCYVPFLIRNIFPRDYRELLGFAYFFNNIINFFVYYASSSKFRLDCKTIIRLMFKKK